jgi:hypothetical protein
MLIGGLLIAGAYLGLRWAPDAERETWRLIGRLAAPAGFILLLFFLRTWARETSNSRTSRILRKVAPLLVFCALFGAWVPLRAHPLLQRKPEARAGVPIDLTAQQVLEKAAATYASCRSYQDAGVVLTTFYGFWALETRRPFATSFVRDGGFRFEYREEQERSITGEFLHGDDRMVIWGDGTRVKTWWTTEDGRIDECSLDMALGGAAGVSGGASRAVPSMLLADKLGGLNPLSIENPLVQGIETIDGHDCYKVVGRHNHRTESVWIDSHTFLLRRVENAKHELDDTSTVEDVTVYDPAINIDIDPAVFMFVPPK